MSEVILESLYDTLKVFIFIFAFYILFSFIEIKITTRLTKKSKMSPLYGSLVGLVPQCGVSVVASDLYLKRHISLGTLMAIFITCSDEALPILLVSGNTKALAVIPLIIIKFVVGFVTGFVIDLFISKKEVEEHLECCCNDDIQVHTGCCCHHIDDEKEDGFDKHMWHPFMHSVKLAIYIFVINLILGIIIHFVGKDNISNFLQINKYITPFFATLIGMIPNCASSVVLAELYISESISFGAILAGLTMNAGLGMIFLFKGKEKNSTKLYILLILLLVSIIVGYVTNLILGF